MRSEKIVGMDVDNSTIVAVVQDYQGRNLIETVVEAEVVTATEFIKSLSWKIRLTSEEETQAKWLNDLNYPLVEEVIVSNPRKNKRTQTENGFTRRQPSCRLNDSRTGS